MAEQQLAFNFINTTLAAEVLIGATSVEITDPVFPNLQAPDFYHAVIEAVGGGTQEVIKVTAVSGTTLTVERGQDNSAAANFAAGDLIELRTTAGLLDRCGQKTGVGVNYKFQRAIVDNPVTIYIDPTGNDVTGDGSNLNPFASPYRAIQETQNLSFGDNGSCIISCAGGTYSMNAALIMDHPEGESISFVGTGAFNELASMPIADYSVDRNAPVVPGRGALELYNTAGTLGANVTSGTRTANRATDSANNKTLLRANVGTVFEWPSAGNDEAKFQIKTALGGFSGIGLIFPAPSGNRHGLHVLPGASFVGTDVPIWGGVSQIKIDGGSFSASSVTLSGGTTGIALDNNGAADIGLTYIQGAAGAGIIVQDGASYQSASTTEISGCGGQGLAVINGRARPGQLTSSGNQSANVQLSSAGNLAGAAVTVSGSFTLGLDVSEAILTVTSLSTIGNNSHGISAEQNAIVTTVVPGASRFNNNGGTGMKCTGGARLALSGVEVNDNTTGIDLLNGCGLVCTTTELTGNSGRAFSSQWSGPIMLGAVTADLTNLSTPHFEARGAGVIYSEAPGAGNVNAGIVFSPTHGTFNAANGGFSDDI